MARLRAPAPTAPGAAPGALAAPTPRWPRKPTKGKGPASEAVGGGKGGKSSRFNGGVCRAAARVADYAVRVTVQGKEHTLDRAVRTKLMTEKKCIHCGKERHGYMECRGEPGSWVSERPRRR